MQKTRKISDLLGGGNALSQLKVRIADRASVLQHVRSSLPQQLADCVVSAGIDGDQLSIGVAGAVWASRIRYLGAVLRPRVSKLAAVTIIKIRVRVVPTLTS